MFEPGNASGDVIEAPSIDWGTPCTKRVETQGFYVSV